MADVDVVTVTYNSRDRIRACVETLSRALELNVIVVDNASTDDTFEMFSDLPVTLIARAANGGFAQGCNTGWRAGSAEYVLFLNPDTRMLPGSVSALRDVLKEDPAVGAAGPLIRHTDGSLDTSQRLLPTPLSDFAQAMFLHRIFPYASWTDGTIHDPAAYAAPRSAEWLSGACLMVRRSLLERLDGFDERFFLYCEDMDLCARIRECGFDVRYDPRAECLHEGGMSAPRSATLPILAASRRHYAEKHFSRRRAALDRIGLVTASLARALGPVRGGLSVRGAHLRSLRIHLLGPR